MIVITVNSRGEYTEIGYTDFTTTNNTMVFQRPPIKEDRFTVAEDYEEFKEFKVRTCEHSEDGIVKRLQVSTLEEAFMYVPNFKEHYLLRAA